MLKKRKLGRTGLMVSELSLGGLFISSYGNAFEEAEKAIKRALELGVNYIDTAPGYMDSEEVLGKVFEKIDTPHIISTKLGYKPEPYRAKDKQFLRDAFDQSLRLLKRDKVDILMVHEPDRSDKMDWWDDKTTCDGPVMEILAELKSQGKVSHVGVGGTTSQEMGNVVATGKFEVLLTAFNYNLIWRDAQKTIFPHAIKHGMGIVAGSPLHQGNLAKMYSDVEKNPPSGIDPLRLEQFKRVYALARDAGLGLPEMAIRFILSNPNVSTVLMGARSVQEVEANVAAAEKGPLPESILRELDVIGKLLPEKPAGEPIVFQFKE